MAKRLLILAFSLIIGLPLGVKLWTVPREPGPGIRVPTLVALTDGLEGVFDDLFDVPALTRPAFAIRHATGFFSFGYLDTPQVISGADAWLFFKEQFRDRECTGAHLVHVATANSIALTQAVARLVGTEIVVAIAPDKSVVHPERLGARAQAFAGCSLDAAADYRATLARLAPSVVDHLEALAWRPGEAQLYWALDTHWNRLGYLRAMAQLRGRLEAGATVDPTTIVEAADTSDRRALDLARIGLGIDLRASGPAGPSEQERAVLGTPISFPGSVVVIHDSFYEAYPETKTLFGDDAQVLNVNRSDDVDAAVATLPDTLVLSSVERASHVRFSGPWSIRGTTLRGVWEAYEEISTGTCADVLAGAPVEAVRPVDLPLATGEPEGSHGFVVQADLLTASSPNCLAVDLGSTSVATLRVWLPPLAGQDAADRFEAGRYLEFDLEGRQVVYLLLPGGLAVDEVLLQPVGGEPEATGTRARIWSAGSP